MASVAAKEPNLSPAPIAPSAESLVPASMFAPGRGCGDDVHGADSFEDGETFNGEAGDHLDFSSKLALVSPNGVQYDSLLRQLRDRMEEGCGETIYVVGVGSDGGDYGLSEADMEASVATVRSLTEQLDADLILLRERTEAGGRVRDFLIRRRVGEADFLEVRVAVVGNVDAGKSTLLGVLTHGELDNGRGFARQKLFRHKHEMESGRTSSVGNDILGFDQEGQVVNKPDSHGGSLDWTKICEKSSKVITFIDLAGHEKYLKTTVFGMTGHLPDFCMLMVGSNAGIVGMTKEHLGLALALNVPVFVVVTKIDMCPANILQETLKLLQRLLKSPGCRKIPVLVQNKDDVIVTASNFSSERMCPIFQISNVTGENMDLLKMFLNLLSSRTSYSDEEPAEFQIDDTYSVPGVGTVVSGTTLRGLIRLNDILLLGPDPLGNFIPIAVKSIHRKRMPVTEVRGGQTASFALKKIKRSSIRKGMVMVSPKLSPQASWEFEAEILVLHHPTTISPRYQAMVHCGSIRQTATILSMNRDCLRTGDKATVHFRFIKTPEYLHTEQRLVFREGRTKAVGTITKLLQSTNNLPSNAKPPQMKMQSVKKAPPRREDSSAAANEELGPQGRPASPHSTQQQAVLEEDSQTKDGNKENKPKSGGGGRRRGGQRHKGKSLTNSTATPAGGVGGC
ncbi:GTP-binding protein 1-like isoform X1 [Brienomyrus brachyistius]|uniref:GTP-binding protein 1-like isoform X1 n=1 Tax=Brienomyrus brachyistius TaxID=42636 RepID=UPI0020B17B68|nr:GTP-binding protein 1-like isoform X1 [Brienomyrus brachyistius]XP_048869530.1 GTP-binding protein 1-like isoform X1 [Brienomyrus brachyistius]XP_048869532.1 GTP-binding protein 1-like isoform X1 [Brienomyrus brachyistius]